MLTVYTITHRREGFIKVKKNILVLTGSARVGGNSDLLADAFVKGALEAGHSVSRFRAGKSHIIGCRGCDECYSKGSGSPCVTRDDFDALSELYKSADVIVYASPLYWYSFPSNLKAAMDKMYALIRGGFEMAIKESVLLACCEDNDPAAFDGMVRSYELIGSYRKWKDAGRVLVCGVRNPGDILKKPGALEQACELGRSL